MAGRQQPSPHAGDAATGTATPHVSLAPACSMSRDGWITEREARTAAGSLATAARGTAAAAKEAASPTAAATEPVPAAAEPADTGCRTIWDNTQLGAQYMAATLMA